MSITCSFDEIYQPAMATDPAVIEEFRLDLETEVNIKISAIFVYFTR